MSSEGRSVEVIILTAIGLEYQEAKKVEAGALPGSRWQEELLNGFPVSFRTFGGAGGRPLRVALARGADMGTNATLVILAPLVEQLNPRCIAMCGVCAGRPDKTSLGDVVVAERLFYHDAGKQLPGGVVEQDLKTYNLRPDWKVALEHFDFVGPLRKEAWWLARPVSYEQQEEWALSRLCEGVDDPSAHAEREKLCPQWGEVVKSLWELGDVKNGTLELTEQGRARAARARIVRGSTPPDLSPSGRLTPFRVHVAPMGSGTKVVEDEAIWGFISGYMRKALGIEMEVAALGTLVELQKHRRLLDALVDCSTSFYT